MAGHEKKPPKHDKPDDGGQDKKSSGHDPPDPSALVHAPSIAMAPTSTVSPEAPTAPPSGDVPMPIVLSPAELDIVSQRIVSEMKLLTESLSTEAHDEGATATGGMRINEATAAAAVLRVARHAPSLFQVEDDGGTSAELDLAAYATSLGAWNAYDAVIRVFDESIGKLRVARSLVGERIRGYTAIAYPIADAHAATNSKIAQLLRPGTTVNHKAAVTRARNRKPQERAQKHIEEFAQADARAKEALDRAAEAKTRVEKDETKVESSGGNGTNHSNGAAGASGSGAPVTK